MSSAGKDPPAQCYVCGRELKEPHAGEKVTLMTTPDDEADGSMEAFEKSLAKAPKDERYVLRLYVTGMTPRSTQAFASIKAICEEHLEGRYELEVIDIYQHPHLAKDEQIIAAPTLVRKLPAPLRRLIGDLSNKERVLLGLDLRRKC